MGGNSTTTSNEPWKPVQEPLKDLYNNVDKMYSAGVGPQVFPGDRVAPWSVPTQQAVTRAYSQASSSPNTGNIMADEIKSNVAGGGLAPSQELALVGMRNFAGGRMNMDPDKMFAVGQTSNPYFQDALNYQLDNAADKVSQYMSRAGRYGSGAMGEAMGREVSGLAANALSNQYNTDVSRRMQIDESNANRHLSGVRGLNDIGQQGQSNVLGFMDRAPTMDDLRYADIDRLFKTGSQIEQYQQRLMDESKGIFDEQNQLPWQYTDLVQNTLQPAAVRFGSSTTKEPFNPMSLLGVPMAMMGGK